MIDTPTEDRAKALVLYFSRKSNGHLTRFQAMKALYLFDLYFTKWMGEQFTNIDWRLYNYGPYSTSVEDVFRELEEDGMVLIDKDTYSQGTRIVAAEKYELPDVPKNLEFMLENVRKRCTGMTTEELTEFIYATEPMVVQDVSPEAKKRMPALDLMLVHEKMKEELGWGN